MFAEELGGNATRRRQEEAKAKRRQLKQQQQKKAQQQQQQQKNASSASAATPPTTGAATASATANAPVQKEANVASIPSTMPPVIATVPAENGKSSAVAIALQQRQQRHAAQNQQKSSIKIQSFYRTHRSNCNLLRHQSTLLDQRLTDLSTLRDLLKQNANTTDYVPPPATSTALCLQLLFLTKMIPYNRREGTARFVKLRDPLKDPKKVQKIMDLVILPGIYSPDENVNPFVVWLQSREGKLRLESLLRVCLVTATSPNVDDQVLKKCMKFVLAVTVPRTNEPKVHPSILNACRSMLLSELPPGTDAKATNTKKKQPQRHARLGSSLDLISILRFHLLYSTGGPQPIPPTSDKLRESCIPAKHRTQADALFQAVLEAVQETSNLSERRNLFLRFVSEILTVPLLTWKTSDTSTSKLLVRDTQNNNNKLLLVSLIENFTDHYGDILTAGDIELILCNDTSLTSCPATPTQCLLANTIQIGRSCIKLNGSDVSKLDYESSATFFRFIATLVDAVPLGTFSSRESVVEWISDGQGHHSPVVLSPVVMEQCKVLLVDAFCRKLFHCAIDQTSLKTDEILALKNDKDLKHEKDLQEAGASAATLAAKEARVDRSKKFWNSSAWARKLTKGVSKMFDSNTNDSASTTSGGKLIDASSVSRKLAQGGSVRNTMETESSTTSGGDAPRLAYTPDLLIALCHVYGIVLARWGGGGGEDIVKGVAATRRDSKGFNQEVATTKADLCTQSLLNVLCFSTSVIRASWGVIQSDSAVVANLYSIIDPSKGNVPVRSLSIRPSYGSSKKRVGNNDGGALLFVFVTTLSHVLIVTDDTEIHDMERPLPLHQLRRCIQTLKQLLYRACCVDDASSSTEGGSFNKSSIRESNYFGLALTYAASRTMRDLYDRSSRRPFCVPKLWLIEDLMEREIRRCKVEGDYVSLLSAPVLRVCPFLVSFKRRLRIFERIITTNRIAIQGENSPNPFHTNPLKPGIPVRITRGRILEDGLATMNMLGSTLRHRIAVQYQNEAGARESGIDAGGLFKEFWTDLCAIAFDPNYALFRITEENCMYPSPASSAAHGSDHIVLFEFLGRILGKALYEGITISPQFAHFFLSHLRGDYNYFHMLPDLSTMDSQLYNNIMFLKTFDGDAEDLCLTFTVAMDDFGGNREIPLMPNGANIPVTNINKQRYIGLVAKYYVVDRIKEQAQAFTRGLWEVIDRSWLRIFNEPELQVLISGPSDGKIDVDDMRANCRYAGGFTGLDRTVNRFWSVVASFERKHQADLLRFVTSCERPPPLGFSSMNPPFTIQRVGILRDGDKLPASSTCFNTLKLPTYSSEKVMRDRLIYAIESGSGFELS